MKSFDQRDLAYYFLNVAEFAVVNDIVVDNDTKAPILHKLPNGQDKFIFYSDMGHKPNPYTMIELDVSKNNKVLETLFNYWCYKQQVKGLRYIKFYNIYHQNNQGYRHTKDMKATIKICYQNMYMGAVTGEEIFETSGVMANDVMAFSYLITKIEEMDINEILDINAYYEPFEV